MPPKEPEDRLFKLNKLQTWILLFTMLAAFSTVIGTFFILPYRVAQIEKDLGDMDARHTNVETTLSTRIDKINDSVNGNTAHIGRIDERTKIFQDELDRALNQTVHMKPGE